MVNETPVAPAGLSVEEKRRLLAARLQERARRDTFPLSFAQQRLWFLHRMDPTSPAYHIPLALRARGGLDADVLAASLRLLVRRHEALRTTFAERDGRPVQVVSAEAPDVLERIDLREMDEAARERELARLAEETAARPFDMERGPLFRAVLARLGDDEWALLFTLHHIVADGWSMGVLVRELSEAYAAHAQGREPALPPLETQYPEFALWQRGWLRGDVLAREIEFWKTALEGAPRLLELPTDRPRPAVAGHRGASRFFTVGRETSEALAALSRREGATLFMTLLAAWQLVLARYSGRDDVVVGTTIAGRTRAELDGVVGFFVNTLPLRADLSGDPTFRGLLARVREATLGAYAHQHLPFEKLVEELGVERTLSHPPLVQALFALQNTERVELRLGEATFEPLAAGAETARFELSLTAAEGPDGIGGALTFRADLFDGATAERMLAHYTALLDAIAADADRPLSACTLLDAAERRRVLETWSAAPATVPEAGRSVHALFAEQAARTPSAPAVAFGNQALTYADVDLRSNRLARHLRSLGVGPDARVGLCLERGVDLIVSILAILKAGGAYVPLDPTQPEDRLRFILDDAGARAVVTTDALGGRFGAFGGSVVRIDADRTRIEEESGEAVGDTTSPENLAYVIYTSGSTGRPKGVMVEHRSVVNLHAALRLAVYDRRTEGGPARVSVNGPVTFDTSVKQIIQLLSGATLCIVPEEARYDAAALASYLRRQSVEVLDCTPAQLRHLLADGLLEKAGAALTDLLVAGEAIDAGLWRWLAGLESPRAWNLYGPTETTVDAALSAVSGARPVLGGPVANARAYVLGAASAPVPAGLPGELFVGGAGVARGYAGRPGLTAERFVPDPFSGVPGARMYRTGDRVRWTADGALEYLGRLDFQLKVRGFRIEPGEIESALEAHASVREAVVVARSDGSAEARLVGYVVPVDGSNVSAAELRAHLAAHLPDYMVPSALVVLDALPLTPNGKVDRKALPAPEAGEADAFVAPRTATEEILAGIFAQVLKAERVGARDGFFALGGHSLVATRVVSRVREAFGVELPLRALFEAPTVEGLAARVDALLREDAGTQAPPLVPTPREGNPPLSFAQQRLWFLQQLAPGSAAYNMPYALRLSGALDVDALERSISEVVRRHEALRTRFPSLDGEPAQVIDAARPIRLDVIDLSDRADDEREAAVRALAADEAMRPFDLARGPLLRATLVRLADDEHALLFTLHHVVSDGWSMNVLAREVSALYAAFSRGLPSPLAELPVQYADYAAWQRAWLEGDVLEAQLGYWRGRLAGAPPLLELPTDRPRPAAADERGASLGLVLPADVSKALRALSREAGATLFMTLLAGVELLLSRYAGADDVVVGTPVANRTRLETEGLIGFFANTLALRTDLSGDPTFRELLARVREGVLEAQAHQDLPFERLVEELAPERSLAHSPLFQVLFVLQNADGEALQMGGLRAETLPAGAETAKFDLTIAVTELEDDALAAGVQYRAELWEAATIERMLGHLRTLLEGIARDPDSRISALPLLGAEERTQVVDGWNATAIDYPADACIHDLFADRAVRTPDAVAISSADGALTYAELDARSNRLARHLRALGVGPDVRVGISLERGAEMMIAVLAVLKAGGAYVPVDPAYPAERVAFMLADSAAPVLITQRSLIDALPATDARVVCVDADADRAAIDGESADRLESGAHPDNLAYVIYTSGSTGRPKGVAMTHRVLVNLLAWQEREWKHPGATATLQFTTLSFDVSFQEIFSCWLSGGRLVLVSEDERRDFAIIADRLENDGIERLFLPYVALQHLAEVAEERGIAPRGLREVQTAGEQLRVTEPIRRFFEATGATLSNQYGPSETHVVTALTLDDDPATWPALPGIGMPIANTRCYVLGPNLEPAPIGVSGELYLGGVSLARGYLDRAALTAERFVPDAFGAAGARMYRTGDRARWLADGTIEFLGRVDDQVKVRGFRIEPGEIEAALSTHAAVREAVVVVREDAPGDRRLVGYVVPSPDAQISISDLRDHLKARLPEYMVPGAFVVLGAFPLTPSGKVARRALPAPESSESDAFVAPRTATEEILAGIFAEVLRAPRVGARDDFFALGGHSLLATRVTSRVRGAFGVELPLRAVFEAPTVEGLAARIDALRRDGAGTQAPPLVAVPRDGDLPLSFAQARLWFIDQLDPGRSTYNLPYALRLRGALNVDALARSIGEVVRRHEALRTRFPSVGGEPAQVIEPARPIHLDVIDLSDRSDSEREAAVQRLAAEEAARPFDLASGPLLRSTLVRLADDEHALLFTLHHIVSDGWSTDVLVREVSALYDAFSRGRPSPLPELPVQYADFAAWQRRWLSGDVLDAQLGYWREKLAGAPPLLEIPTDRPRSATVSDRGGNVPFTLSAEATDALRELARREGATLYMTLLAAWQLLLSRYSGQDDVSVGTPIAGRTRVETEGLIGFFVNTLVLRTDLSGDPSFRALLGRVRETTLGAYQHQEIPFEKLVEELAPERSLSHTPLFQAMLILQNTAREALRLGDLEAEPLAGAEPTVKFDLTLAFAEAGDALSGGLAYRAELFDAETMERMLEHFRALLESVAADPDRPVSSISFLAESERRALAEWNATERPYALDSTLHSLIEAQARRTPNAVAVVFEEESLTYAELDARSNQLARRLRVLGVGAESRVGICLERSPEMVVALLAVLKAGGAYVPVDPSYPADRIAYMLADSGVAVLLTQSKLAASLPEHGARVLNLDADAAEIAAESADALDVHLSPDNLAYVIYTSGSTGRPKGAMNAHRGIVNRLLWMQEQYGLDASDVVLQKTPFSFDVSVWEFFWPLMTGARLVLARPGAHGDPAYLADVIEGQGITTLHFVPSMLQAFLDAGDVARCGSIRRVICSGEALSYETMERALEAFLAAGVHNLYGPTEAAVDVTFWPCEPRPERRTVPIGRPVANTRIHVLDPSLNPAPIGVAGELYIGGVQVGRGYLDRPSLTAERFVPDPFSPDAGARLYRTGDRARWTARGEVEYLGRADFQVKIRGFRIEPGEVEAALRSIDGIGEAVVVVREDAGEKRLVAYVVAAPGAEWSVDAVRGALRADLPEYMVPQAIVSLDALPLSPNGKVDRKALPAPESPVDAAAYVAPRTPAEETVAAIFAEVLRVERVGARDDFFAMGGHSLLATRAISRVRDAFAVDLPLRALFEAPTVEQLAARVESAAGEEAGTPAPPLVPVPREGDLPLSFAQARLWFIDQLDPDSLAYHMPYAIRLRGPLDVGALERALTEIVRRHEALRTRFPSVDGEPAQVIEPAGPFRISRADFSELADAERDAAVRDLTEREAARPFDLARGPLLRCKVARLGDDDHAVFITLHHIVSDGWSMGVLAREVSVLYDAFTRGLPSPLAPLPVQYADYAAWQRAWLAEGVLSSQLAYWKERLAGAPPLLEIPTDRPRPQVLSGRGGAVPVVLSAEAARGLRELSRKEGTTLFMTLLAAWQLLLSRWSGQDDVVVGAPVANRVRAETESLIGFFVNTLALRADLSGAPTVRQLLARARETVIEAQASQDLPFDRLVEELGGGRALNRTPVFQALFAFQNQAAETLQMGGIDAEPLSVGADVARFDLTLSLGEAGGTIRGAISYRAELWDRPTIERMVAHLRLVLEAFAADADRRVPDIDLVSAAERDRLLALGAAPAPFPADRTVHALFAEQAARTPHDVAIVFGDETLTYAELDGRSNQLARHLRGLGVGPDVKVALCVERAPEMVVGLLGVLKAGGAYVPLDLGYPAERLAFMAADANVRVLLTQERLIDSLPEHDGAVVCLDRDWPRIASESVEPIEVDVSPDHLAYVIYTSGSTGIPKGTEVPHRAIPGFFRGVDYVSYDAGQVHLQHASTSWDVLTLELWPALLTGARCVLYPGRASEPGLLGEQVRAHGVTILWLSAAYFNLVVDTAPDVLAGVRQVMTGGEAVSPAHARRALELYPEMRLVNGYGPSECTVFATTHVIPRGFDAPAVPIGAPVGDRRVHLVDARMRLVPAGVAGELCVGGPAVARGYLNRAAMTAERFVPDPFGEPGARLYRTGDRARWRNDGTLEFVGRVDFQVKIRGFRVEPGEVEAALLADPRVRETVVAVREDVPGDRRLVAYAVPADGAALSTADLRSMLKARLPEYMVPSAFVLLGALPISAHGKVDRARLPVPEISADEDAYLAPRTPAEEMIAGMFAEVLRVDRVGARDDFFALGGHSLLATRLVSRVRQAFGVELPLRALFEESTVEGLAARVDALRREGSRTQAPPLVPVPREGALPLSFAQQRLWFIHQMEPESAAYNVPFALKLTGGLSVAALERSLAALVARHETLRTRFPSDGGRPVQVIDAPGAVPLEIYDLRALPPYEREEALREMTEGEAIRPFNLSTGPLLRCTLVHLADHEQALLFTMHHVVSDGWSVSVLVREVSELYAAFAEGREARLPALPVQYADFAAWQRAWLAEGVLDQQLAYWKAQLTGAPPLLEIPTDRPRPLAPSDRGGSAVFTLSAETTDALRALSRREGATLFMTLMAAWQLLLSRYSGQDDVSVGTPIAGRTRLETEGLIGCFINTLVLRTVLWDNPTFRALLSRVRETTLGAYQNQEIPFEKLVEEIAPERSLSHTPLFQAMLILQNNAQESLSLGGVNAEPLSTGDPAVKFDLNFALAETGDTLAGTLVYRAELFDAATIERMLGHFRALLEAVVADPDRPVFGIAFLGDAERRRVLEEWNASDRPYALDSTLHSLVEAQARRTPGAVAVVFEDEQLTYAELDARSNQLARHLRTLGAGPEVRVGICAERSPEMVVALLGVLKSGGAYVPIDPSYPAERVAYMLEDSGVPVVLTQERLAASLPAHGARVLRLDADWPEIAAESPDPLDVEVTPDGLAYVIYTSGSTGKPKGAMNAHRGIVNRLLWMQEEYRLDAGDVVLQKTPFSFDVSVWEFFWPLMTGARMVLARPGAHGDPAYLAGLIEGRGITTLHFVPSMLQAFLDAGAAARCGSVRRVICSGEALSYELMERALAALPEAGVHNLYGPTEAAVDVTYWACERRERRVVPIGRPVANTRMYVLDEALNAAPVGVAGELYIGGVQVGRGYFGRPALTAEKFVPDPFSAAPGARLYRTGDRARWSARGEIEYLGRTDFQVKIRGFRIELGEIEAALRRHPGGGECVVTARADIGADPRLVAYVASGTATAATLRAYLKDQVPEHMVPAAFVVLDRLPLSPNGKVDRRSLPAPDFAAEVAAFVAPRTPTEEIVAGMFEEVLAFGGIPPAGPVGAEADFFALGGHSLLATRLVSRVEEAFGVELPLRLFFEAPTVAGIAERVDGLRREHLPPLTPIVPVDDFAPRASFAQERIWREARTGRGALHHLSTAIRLEGALDRSALERAVAEVVRRHDALRTVFAAERDGSVTQIVLPYVGFSLDVEDLPVSEDADRDSEARRRTMEIAARPYDLAGGPLFRAALLRLQGDEHVLVLAMHGAVADEQSLDIIRRELSALYGAFAEGLESPLPEPAVRYADFAAWQRGQLAGEALERRLAYWKDRLTGVHALLGIPTDRPRSPDLTHRAVRERVDLPSDLRDRLAALAQTEGATLSMVLLAAFQTVLAKHAGSDDVAVAISAAGRPRKEMEDLVGPVATTLLLRTDLSGDPTFRETLRRVREAALGAYDHQDVPFEMLSAELQPEDSAGDAPLFQSTFDLKNGDSALPDFPGLVASEMETESEVARSDLALRLATHAEGIGGHIEYAADLFDRATISRVLAAFVRLLEAAADDADVPLSHLDFFDG